MSKQSLFKNDRFGIKWWLFCRKLNRATLNEIKAVSHSLGIYTKIAFQLRRADDKESLELLSKVVASFDKDIAILEKYIAPIREKLEDTE